MPVVGLSKSHCCDSSNCGSVQITFDDVELRVAELE